MLKTCEFDLVSSINNFNLFSSVYADKVLFSISDASPMFTSNDFVLLYLKLYN